VIIYRWLLLVSDQAAFKTIVETCSV